MNSNLIVAKFGGTSCANTRQFRKVLGIIHSDPRHRVIVASAPGRRFPEDTKVTDMLIECHELACMGGSIEHLRNQIADRFREISKGFNLQINLEEILDDACRKIKQMAAEGGAVDYAESRGEAIIGPIVAEMLGATYIDALEVIHFDRRGQVTAESYRRIAQRCAGDGLYVISGFYGLGFDGNVKTFSRGGSDVTGAIVASALDASIYDNWTDVPGVLMTDPRIVPRATTISEITYRELREMAYAGANVLHAETVFPVQEKGIPIHVRNTNDPEHPGTWIVAERNSDSSIIGIAGAKDFTSYDITMPSMLTQVGFAQQVFEFFENKKKPVDHFPSGIDNFSVIVSDRNLGSTLDSVSMQNMRDELAVAVNCDTITTRRLALVVLVGQDAMGSAQTHVRIFRALAKADITIEALTQSTPMSIVIGIDRAVYESAIRALYDEFAPIEETNT